MRAISRGAATAVAAAFAAPAALAAPPNIFFLSNTTKVDVTCSIALDAAAPPSKVLIGGSRQWIDSSLVGSLRLVSCAPPVVGSLFRLKRGQRYLLQRRQPAATIELVRVAAGK
ncbi:MAG TPA: hypothetical protein VGB08_00485 [Allosphingosinicella sp.]|jgi:hypothetical protein